MTTAVKAITIGSVLAALIIPPSGYAIWSATRDDRITAKEWLEKNGYAFSKPTYKEQDESKGACSENLFSNRKKESDIESDQKLYACSVTKMDVQRVKGWAGLQQAMLPKMKIFNYELAIKKGNEGWVINSKVENSFDSENTSINYKLTRYSYSNNTWTKGNEMNLWNKPAVISGDSATQEIFSGGAIFEDLEIKGKKIIIKLSKRNDSEGVERVNISSSDPNKTERAGWALAWVELSHGHEFLMFDEIEIQLNGKKYSPQECKEGENKGCIAIPQDSDEASSYSLTNEGKTIIGKTNGSIGFWSNVDALCEASWGKSLSDREKLFINYCSNGKKSS